MGKRVYSNAEGYSESDHLMEVDVVVEGDDDAELGSASEPCDGVSADGEEDEGHIEFQGLGGALGGGDAVPHDFEHFAVLVLNELPGKETGADG